MLIKPYGAMLRFWATRTRVFQSPVGITTWKLCKKKGYVDSLILKVKINYNYELFHNHFCYKLHDIVTFLAWCSAGLSIDLSEIMSIQWAVPSIRMTRSSSTEVSFQTTLNSVHGSMLPWSEITSHVQSLHSTLSLHAYEWTQTHIITQGNYALSKVKDPHETQRH